MRMISQSRKDVVGLEPSTPPQLLDSQRLYTTHNWIDCNPEVTQNDAAACHSQHSHNRHVGALTKVL